VGLPAVSSPHTAHTILVFMVCILADDLQDYNLQILGIYLVVELGCTILPSMHKIPLEVFSLSLSRLERGAVKILDPMAYSTRLVPVGVAVPIGDLVRAKRRDVLDVAAARVAEVGRFGVLDRFHAPIIRSFG